MVFSCWIYESEIQEIIQKEVFHIGCIQGHEAIQSYFIFIYFNFILMDFYQFQMYNIVVLQLYTLGNVHHKYSDYLSLCKVIVILLTILIIFPYAILLILVAYLFYDC